MKTAGAATCSRPAGTTGVIDTATVTPDPEIAAMVAGFQQALDREMGVPLTVTAVALDSRNATVRGREAAIGNLIADRFEQLVIGTDDARRRIVQRAIIDDR